MAYLDIVNEKDEVIGKALQKDIYQKGHLHRIVHIFIFNSKGEMALQLRSATDSYCPSHWSTPVGGHVHSQESYEQAALREFQEELGTTSPLHFFAKDFYPPQKFLTIFKTTYNGPFNLNPEEVQDIRFFSLPKMKEMMSTEKFLPELLFLLKKHFKL